MLFPADLPSFIGSVLSPIYSFFPISSLPPPNFCDFCTPMSSTPILHFSISLFCSCLPAWVGGGKGGLEMKIVVAYMQEP